jgi:hypothetical protein
MADNLADNQYRRPMGLLEAILGARILRYYKDLILMQCFVYFGDKDERSRLAKKYDKFFTEGKINPNFKTVNKEVNKLTARLHFVLERINAPTEWSIKSQELEYDYDKKRNVETKTKEHFDVILDRQFPSFRKHMGFRDIELTIPMLEQAIGYYDLVWQRYWLKIINPLWWIAVVARLPISLMEHMGVNTATENINKFVYWLVQGLVILILSFIAFELGIQVDLNLFR